MNSIYEKRPWLKIYPHWTRNVVRNGAAPAASPVPSAKHITYMRRVLMPIRVAASLCPEPWQAGPFLCKLCLGSPK